MNLNSNKVVITELDKEQNTFKVSGDQNQINNPSRRSERHELDPVHPLINNMELQSMLRPQNISSECSSNQINSK